MNEEARPPPPKSGVIERLKASPVTFAILAINVVWFLWAEHHGSTETNAVLLRFGAVEPIHVWTGEYWRVASYMFLHIGWVHLLWNSYAGFSICAGVERALGQRRFLLAYLLSGIAGGAATVVTDYSGSSAGASGAMFGMLGALIALRHRQLGDFNALLKDGPTRATLVNAGIWILIGTQLNFNNRAHVGGLVAGAIVTYALTSPDRLMPIVAAGFGAVLLVAFRPWWQPQGLELEKLQAYGASYLIGANGFAKNVQRGERFSRRACDAGSDLACQLLAFNAMTDGSDAEKEQAQDVLKKDCDEGKTLACDILARQAEQAGDTAKAAELYAKACDGDGPKNACTRLGFLKLYDKGTTPDYAAIAALFEKACSGGDRFGCAGRGFTLRYGFGVDKDEARGETLLQDSCNDGDAWSCAVLDAGAAAEVSTPPEE